MRNTREDELLPGHWSATQIDGVLYRVSAAIGDDRGSFTELWRSSWTDNFGDERFIQANLSRSTAGVLRGMHFHERQADLWMVVSGRVLSATTDVRGLTSGDRRSVRSQMIELTVGASLYIPRLVAHGFWALEDTALMYLVSNEYDGSDEHGFRWDDPTAAIPWPPGQPIVSDRDRMSATLAEIARRLAM